MRNVEKPVAGVVWPAVVGLMVGLLLAAVGAAAQPLCDPADNPLGMSLAQYVGEPGHYTPGGVLDITLRATAACLDQYSGPDTLELTQTPPAGWTYAALVSVSEGPAPDTLPDSGSADEFTLAWTSPPALPVTLTYRLNVPEDTEGDVQLIGQAVYALEGESYVSDTSNTAISASPDKGVFCCGTAAYERGHGGRADAGIALLVLGVLGFLAARRARQVQYGGGTRMRQLPMQTARKQSCLFVLPVLVFLGVMGFSGRCFGALTDPTGDPAVYNPLGMTLTHALPAEYDPASLEVEIAVTMDIAFDEYPTGGELASLGLAEMIPDGWSFARMGELISGTTPNLSPAAGVTGELDFAWFVIPTADQFPIAFTYFLTIPEGESTPQTIEGQIIYYTNESALYSDIASLVLSEGGDSVAPELTLLGGEIVAIERDEAYVEPGYTATDDVDGDITDLVEVAGTVDTATIGTYILIYSVSDTAGNTAAKTRTVKVVKPKTTIKEFFGCGPAVPAGNGWPGDAICAAGVVIFLLWTYRRGARTAPTAD